MGVSGLLVVLSLLVGAGPSRALMYTVTDLGPSSSGVQSRAYSLDETGRAVGHTIGSGGTNSAFTWDSLGGMQSLNMPTGYESLAFDLNEKGEAVGRTVNGAVLQAVRWNPDGTRTTLGTLGGSESSAYGISESGQMSGLSNPAGNPVHRAVRWGSDGTVEALTDLGGKSSQAYGINDTGQVAGFSYLSGNTTAHAVRWGAGGTPEDLGSLGGSSAGEGINSAGEVAGISRFAGETQANAVWWDSSGEIHDIGRLGGNVSEARDINDARQVVGYSETSTGDHAFVWEGGVLYDLNDLLLPSSQSWTLQSALGINDRGLIVGYGLNAAGETHAFLATPNVPEPASCVLLALAAGGIGAMLRRRRKG